MERELLRIDNLGAWYKREKNVLSGFSLELREHEAVGLIGLNGAGKTTLLKILSGLHENFAQMLSGCMAVRRNSGTKTLR